MKRTFAIMVAVAALMSGNAFAEGGTTAVSGATRVGETNDYVGTSATGATP